MIKTLYLQRDKQTLIVMGHFNHEEIKELKLEGYREREPQVNKNGIRVEVQQC